jgi:hypothetical protein
VSCLFQTRSAHARLDLGGGEELGPGCRPGARPGSLAVVADRLAVPLSVLDQCPVPTGESVGEALRRSLDLARNAERWGLRRYWVAEHHGLPGIASTAPAVLAGQLAAATSAIRVGSGGVMLPNHAPLTVAEQFGTLEAMYPGRIDLGIGRERATGQRCGCSGPPASCSRGPPGAQKLIRRAEPLRRRAGQRNRLGQSCAAAFDW